MNISTAYGVFQVGAGEWEVEEMREMREMGEMREMREMREK
ncbi:hypothetical protein [Calothrix sp. PCC 7507]|nr:hypothetical protein [Calothrix sp. PCC 7507]